MKSAAPILITAFGPFGGRSENASSLVLLKLRKAMPEIRSRILPVDAVLAPSRLRQAILRIRPSAVIMLGESRQSQKIQLEKIAWNLKDFSIPDVAGRKYRSTPIRREAGDSMRSSLPLEEIEKALLKKNYPVGFSEDPGRYLCNQLFFNVLDFLDTKGLKIPAGFIHLPLEEDLPTNIAAEAIEEVVRAVRG